MNWSALSGSVVAAVDGAGTLVRNLADLPKTADQLDAEISRFSLSDRSGAEFTMKQLPERMTQEFFEQLIHIDSSLKKSRITYQPLQMLLQELKENMNI